MSELKSLLCKKYKIGSLKTAVQDTSEQNCNFKLTCNNLNCNWKEMCLYININLFHTTNIYVNDILTGKLLCRNEFNPIFNLWEIVLWLRLWKKSLLYTLFSLVFFLWPHGLWLSHVAGLYFLCQLQVSMVNKS